MTATSRRSVLAAAASLAAPGIIRAQTVSAPITIGYVSDVSGQSVENGGPGNKLAAEMAVADFGGSVLGRPVEVIQADGHNKPDIASTIVREWIDGGGVSLIADGANSPSALAIQQITRERRRIYVMTSPISNSLIGNQCSPYGFQFSGNAYSFTKGVTESLTHAGGDTWFTIVVNYESGIVLERDMRNFVTAAGGKVVGGVRTPFDNADFSSYLLQAQTSGAKVIGLGLSGQDLQNCVKQAAEFGVSGGTQRLATPVLADPDVKAIGQEACKGLLLSAFFFWNLNPESRAFASRFSAAARKPPTAWHASSYAAVAHWLKAVRDAGTLDADAVAVRMRASPLSFFGTTLGIYANGCVPYEMNLLTVKPPSETKVPFDYFSPVATLPSAEANPPPGLFGCTLKA